MAAAVGLDLTSSSIGDEVDAAQEQGGVRTRADNQLVPDENKLSAEDIGLTAKDIFEARQIRDAEHKLDHGSRITTDHLPYEGNARALSELLCKVLRVIRVIRGFRDEFGGRTAHMPAMAFHLICGSRGCFCLSKAKIAVL